MSSELEFNELPELELRINVTHDNGKPVLILKKKVSDPQKIKILAGIIMANQYLPAKILVKDKLLFYSQLKKEKII